MNREFDRLEEDYGRQAARLARLSKAINRLSPAAGFVYAATDLAGTGIDDDARIKEEVARYKNRIIEDILANRRPFPAFSHRSRSAGQALAEGALIDIGWEVAVATPTPRGVWSCTQRSPGTACVTCGLASLRISTA